MLRLSEVEQGIKDAIKALNRPYLRTIKTYGGEFDDELEQVVKNFPAVWVTFSGSTEVRQKSARLFHIGLRFTVLVGARSQRNEEAARHGAMVDGKTVSVGSFQLLDDQMRALMGQTLNLPITQLVPGRIATVFNGRTENESVSVLSMDWETYVDLRSFDPCWESAPWMQGVNVNYDLLQDGETDLVVTESVILPTQNSANNSDGMEI